MKYEKPVLKDLLGYEAEGYDCGSGSTASPQCSNGGNVDPSCSSGSSADGNCGSGTGARGSECHEGTGASNNCYHDGNQAMFGECGYGIEHISGWPCSQGVSASGCGYGIYAGTCDTGSVT